MPVPLLDVNAQNHPLEADLTAAFTRVLRSGIFIMGAEVDTFEQACADLLGTKHAIGVSSGTDAILLALMALGIGPGDEVLVPAFTFFATAGCVSRVGATPVFVDVCPIDFNIDTTKAAAKITARTKAIIPVHLFGQSSDMRAVMALAKEHGLKVVEDAAQAIGAKYHGQCCGTFGDFGTYSFFPSKNLGGLGDGGLLTTENDELAEMARVMRVHGSKPKYYHHYIGGNFRLDALQAALLGVKLAHYTDYSDQRQANAAYYTKHLSQLPDVTSKLLLPVALPDLEHIWNQYTLRVLHGRRDALRQHLADRNIGCEIYYPLTLDQQTCFASTSAFSRSDCEVSHQLANEVISIPIYPELSEAQKASVVAAIAEFLKQ